MTENRHDDPLERMIEAAYGAAPRIDPIRIDAIVDAAEETSQTHWAPRGGLERWAAAACLALALASGALAAGPAIDASRPEPALEAALIEVERVLFEGLIL